ncbi:HLH domain-containing protein [Oryctes borbonicus]|uniref:HLH domain-containing protein n=1 Tax=Oryctes borbonicus TaxID=1629725 RepID=A0A0T6ASX0_9SCAR|nr:HLH domain-containing protein [Oryctes borbonicus]
MKLFPIVVLMLGVLVYGIDGKRKRKFDGDFEFAEEEDTKSGKAGEKKRWIHDPTSPLCRPLNCKKKEICLLEDSSTAVCVSKKELEKNDDVVIRKLKLESASHKHPRSEDTDEDVYYDAEDDPDDDIDDDVNDSSVCNACPVAKPSFLCGSDNRTYSSWCRLDYHNCIHHTSIQVSCKGFCPCKENDVHSRKKQRQQERNNNFMNKKKATLFKTENQNNGYSTKDSKQSQSSSKLDVYTFTPQDLKYDNKHYKYFIYSKPNKDNYLYVDDKQKAYNEVLDNKLYNSNNMVVPATPVAKECSPSALQSMGNRLLDWFSVVMSDSSKRRKPRNKVKSFPVRFSPICKGEVRWMFQHLDLNSDGRLSLQELYDLEHDQSEICLKPFLQQCDINHDDVVIPAEWCHCFQRTERPCAAVKRKITPNLIGDYVPDCDSQGYYKPTQCHNAIGMCWCVDKHGVEFANTRTHSKPNCDSLVNKANDVAESKSPEETNNDDEEDDIEQDIEGSADHPDSY